jgi:hypothetical protein
MEDSGVAPFRQQHWYGGKTFSAYILLLPTARLGECGISFGAYHSVASSFFLSIYENIVSRIEENR